MRRMSKPSKNNTKVLFLVSPTAYKGTSRARFAYSIKLVLCGMHFFCNPFLCIFMWNYLFFCDIIITNLSIIRRKLYGMV